MYSRPQWPEYFINEDGEVFGEPIPEVDPDYPQDIVEGFSTKGREKLSLIKANLDFYSDLAFPIKRKGNLTQEQKSRLEYYDSIKP